MLYLKINLNTPPLKRPIFTVLLDAISSVWLAVIFSLLRSNTYFNFGSPMTIGNREENQLNPTGVLSYIPSKNKSIREFQKGGWSVEFLRANSFIVFFLKKEVLIRRQLRRLLIPVFMVEKSDSPKTLNREEYDVIYEQPLRKML